MLPTRLSALSAYSCFLNYVYLVARVCLPRFFLALYLIVGPFKTICQIVMYGGSFQMTDTPIYTCIKEAPPHKLISLTNTNITSRRYRPASCEPMDMTKNGTFVAEPQCRVPDSESGPQQSSSLMYIHLFWAVMYHGIYLTGQDAVPPLKMHFEIVQVLCFHTTKHNIRASNKIHHGRTLNNPRRSHHE